MRIPKLGLYFALFSALALCFGCADPYVNEPASVQENAAIETPIEQEAYGPDIQSQELMPEALIPETPQSSLCGSGEGYKLGPEDALSIQIYNEQDLSGTYQISTLGLIDMPLIGELPIAGCTLKEAENAIYAAYTDGYLVDPSIVIEVENYRPFFIIGEVRAPGKYDYAVDMTVLKAAALAGGFTYRANRNTARIAKHDAGGQVIYENRDIENAIQPGEVIIIKERLF